jgi:predicted amidohydrolase
MGYAVTGGARGGGSTVHSPSQGDIAVRVAIAQIDFTIGAFESNLEQLHRVAALSDERLGIVVGYVDRNPSSTGKELHNAAALCVGGRVIDRYRKCLLPTYDVFDEARYFDPGDDVRVLRFHGLRLGISVCEDVWSDPDFDGRSLYHRDPVMELVDDEAEILINISASPFELGKAALRRELVQRYAASSGRYFIYLNQVGGNDELVFDGHSIVVDPMGQVVVRARDFAEDLLVFDVPTDGGEAGPGELREVANCEEEQVMRALELGLRDYLAKCGFEEVVLGLSGGIDSALTAAIAARSIGPDKVLGVAHWRRIWESTTASYPSMTSSRATWTASVRCLKDSTTTSRRRISRHGFGAGC